MSGTNKDIESQIRALKDDLKELTREAYLKRYREALKDAIRAVKQLPGTATPEQIIAAGTVTIPDPGDL